MGEENNVSRQRPTSRAAAPADGDALTHALVEHETLEEAEAYAAAGIAHTDREDEDGAPRRAEAA